MGMLLTPTAPINSPDFTGDVTITGGTVTASTPIINGTQTWNNAGVTFRGAENVYTITAAAAASTVERWLGGAAGTTVLQSLSGTGVLTSSGIIFGTDNTYDIGASGATRPRNGYFGGSVLSNIFVAQTGFRFGDGTTHYGYIQGFVDGVFRFVNNAGTDFNRIQLGGATSSFPALKRATVNLEARLADDSAYTGIVAATAKTVAGTLASLGSASTAGAGTRAFINDGSTTVILGLGTTAAGGGANNVPVYSDGTNWIYG